MGVCQCRYVGVCVSLYVALGHARGDVDIHNEVYIYVYIHKCNQNAITIEYFSPCSSNLETAFQ